jgi:hypothetical protein
MISVDARTGITHCGREREVAVQVVEDPVAFMARALVVAQETIAKRHVEALANQESTSSGVPQLGCILTTN